MLNLLRGPGTRRSGITARCCMPVQVDVRSVYVKQLVLATHDQTMYQPSVTQQLLNNTSGFQGPASCGTVTVATASVVLSRCSGIARCITAFPGLIETARTVLAEAVNKNMSKLAAKLLTDARRQQSV